MGIKSVVKLTFMGSVINLLSIIRRYLKKNLYKLTNSWWVIPYSCNSSPSKRPILCSHSCLGDCAQHVNGPLQGCHGNQRAVFQLESVWTEVCVLGLVVLLCLVFTTKMWRGAIYIYLYLSIYLTSHSRLIESAGWASVETGSYIGREVALLWTWMGTGVSVHVCAYVWIEGLHARSLSLSSSPPMKGRHTVCVTFCSNDRGASLSLGTSALWFQQNEHQRSLEKMTKTGRLSLSLHWLVGPIDLLH